MTLLWHDDVRPAPEGWKWARTNDEAKKILERDDVVECSLDHDMGWNHLDESELTEDQLLRGIPPRRYAESGLDLVRWMVEVSLVPARVTIHSWNPYGAQMMAAHLERNGYKCVVLPFQARR